MKALLLTGALGLMGYSGWEAASLSQGKDSCSHKTQCLFPGEVSEARVASGECTQKSECATGAGCPEEAAGAGECCEPAPKPVVPVSAAKVTSAAAEGWGTLKGQVVYGGPELPKPVESKVTSDQGHCLAKGPLFDKVWDVDPSSKGVANVVVFILPERGETLPVHESYQATPAPFTLDQPHCVFTPRVFALRKGQILNAKNPDPVAHNVVIKGIRNDINVQTPPGSEKQLSLVPEANALAVSCGSHPWMKGYAWCFDHPYYAVTDKDGKFEIKNVPAGARRIVIWHETGYLPGYSKRDQNAKEFSSGGVVDLGQITATPK